MFVNWLRKTLITLLFGKGGDEMLAMLWAQMIILGKKKFSAVPASLKEAVREILIDSGCEHLIDE